jgi:tagatose-1,6-bisphosphate aldolase
MPELEIGTLMMKENMMSTLSLGKYRLLQQCSTSNNALAVLALDHRNNLRHALRPDKPEAVTDEEMSAFKQQVIGVLAPAASAVLLDPEVGAAQCIASGALPGNIGLLSALEATGYTGDPTARESQVLPGWSVEKARRMGANAVKLLVYYHPDAPTAAPIEALVKQVADECAQLEMPLFLEPLSYSHDPSRKKLLPQERYEVVIETARRLTPLGVDILKAEFPLDIAAESDETRWYDACAELTKASVVPWVLLSASVAFEVYLKQVTIACQAGASGVAVGRAVWQEATSLSGEERSAFLRDVAYRRMKRTTDLCNALARPWTDYFSAPSATGKWYAAY